MTKPSDPPNGVKIYIPPKLVAIVIAVLVGSGAGGLGISSLFHGKEASKEDTRNSNRHRDRGFNVRFEKIDKTLDIHTEQIVELDEQVNQIQTVQHNDIARGEARRVTEGIPNKRRRLDMEDRIYEINLTRLRDGKTPCLNLDCSN